VRKTIHERRKNTAKQKRKYQKTVLSKGKATENCIQPEMTR
jgi:hypothetical protein